MPEPPDEVLDVQLDDRVLDRLADLICDDDGTIQYRTGPALVQLFRSAGWRVPGELDGESRWRWTRDRLREKRNQPDQLRALLLRLADRREYLDRPAAAAEMLRKLNETLSVEGLRIEPRQPHPRLVRLPAGALGLEHQAPLQLTANLAALVGDTEFGALLRQRLDEAERCWAGQARLACVIMLGSLLEGVLHEIARQRQGGSPSDTLDKLINLAVEEQWVRRDIADYLRVVKDHRNLVHPRRQQREGQAFDDESVTLAWNVVVVTLNALAESPDPAMQSPPG